LCAELETRTEFVAQSEDSINCWVRDYKTAVEERGEIFPILDEATFYTNLDIFLSENPDLEKDLYYVDRKLKYMQISGKVDVAPWGPPEIRAPFIDLW
jgi:hypothetical protein